MSQSCSSLTSHVRPDVVKLRSASSEHNLDTLAVQITVASSSGYPVLLSLSKAFFPSFLPSNLAARCEFKLHDRTLNFDDPPFIRLILDSLTQQLPDSGRLRAPLMPRSPECVLEDQPQTRFFQQFVTSIQRRVSGQTAISRFARMFTPSQATLISLPAGKGVSSVVVPIEISEGQPVLRRRKLARLAKRKDPLNTMGWLNVSPRALAIQDGSSYGLITTPESERMLDGSGLLADRTVECSTLTPRPSSSGADTQRL